MDEPFTRRRTILAGGALAGSVGWYVASSNSGDDDDRESESAESEDEIVVVVETDPSIDQSISASSFNGELRTLEGATAVTVGFEWRKAGESTWAETRSQVLGSPGEFSVAIGDLEPDTTYEYRAVAEVGNVTEYGSTRTLTTEAVDIELAVDAIEATDVTGWDVTLVGELSELQDAETASVKFEWRQRASSEGNPSESDSWNDTDVVVLESPGRIDATVGGLASLTEYEFRVVAEAEHASAESDVLTFTTRVNPNPSLSGGSVTVDSNDETESDGSTDSDVNESGTDTTRETTYWQIDFGEGGTPPDPPTYWPDDLMAALGNTADGVTENPSFRRQQTAGQLADVEIVHNEFEFDDANEPSAVTVEFTVAEGGAQRSLHLASFVLPGEFRTDEIDQQERFEYASASFDGGETGKLTVEIPQSD